MAGESNDGRRRELRKEHSSERFGPLNREQIEAFDAAAREIEDDLTKLSARTLLYTGLRIGEFCHLRRGWIENNPSTEVPQVHIPSEERCIGGSNENASCNHRQNSPNGWWATKSDSSVRTSPILRESVAELMIDWFYHHRQVPNLHGQVTRYVKRVANEAELEREILPQNLRHTYGAMLASKGLGPHLIKSAMGFDRLEQTTLLIDLADDEIEALFDEQWDSEIVSEADDDSTEPDNDN